MTEKKSRPVRTPRAPRQSKIKSAPPRRALDPEVLDREEESEASERDDAEPSDEEVASEAALVPHTRDSLSENGDRDVAAISPFDPLRRYLEEIRRHPLLEPEEEFRLALQLRDRGDLDSAKKLVQANLRLVVKIAFEYRNFYSNMMDLIQEGNIGLMKAVSKFDPTKGARLGYYSSWWIRSYILKYLLDNFRLVKLGTTQSQKKLFYHLMREKEKLEAQGLLAGPKLLAERLDVREKDVIEMEQRLSSRGAEMSLDTPIGGADSESSSPLSSILGDGREGADEILAHQELLDLLRDRLPAFRKLLDEKEERILSERLLAEEPKTLQEVADLYGLTRERARQIESKVIAKLREFLRSDLEP